MLDQPLHFAVLRQQELAGAPAQQAKVPAKVPVKVPAKVPAEQAKVPASATTIPYLRNAGKTKQVRDANLPSCSRGFELIALPGTYPTWHWHRCGVYITVRCISGEKHWIIAHLLGPRELRFFAETRHLPDGWPTYKLILKAGDELIMTPQTVHAPFTCRPTHMRGTMHMLGSRMVDVMRTAVIELLYPAVTNEDPAGELKQKADLAQKLASGGGVWPEHVHEMVEPADQSMYKELSQLHDYLDT